MGPIGPIGPMGLIKESVTWLDASEKMVFSSQIFFSWKE